MKKLNTVRFEQNSLGTSDYERLDNITNNITITCNKYKSHWLYRYPRVTVLKIINRIYQRVTDDMHTLNKS